ncbi:hypothetical protein GQR58_030651 [Nymphon striatum]|nr:hypothetical protein GQR58_030651 [Nymphon striatum]
MVTKGMPMPLVLFNTAPRITDTMTTTIWDVVMRRLDARWAEVTGIAKVGALRGEPGPVAKLGRVFITDFGLARPQRDDLNLKPPADSGAPVVGFGGQRLFDL